MSRADDFLIHKTPSSGKSEVVLMPNDNENSLKRKYLSKTSKRPRKKSKVMKLGDYLKLYSLANADADAIRKQLTLANSELKKRVMRSKSITTEAHDVDTELRMVQQRLQETKLRRRRQKAEKKRVQEDVQKARKRIHRLRSTLAKEEESNRRALERLLREKKKLEKQARIVGNVHEKNVSKYDIGKLAPYLKPLGDLLQKIYSCASKSMVFAQPVDHVRYPNYRRTIARPICLNQIRSSLFNNIYPDERNFLRDLMQVWVNAQQFNSPNHQVHQWAKQFQDLTEQECKSRGWKVPSRSELLRHTIKKSYHKKGELRPLTQTEVNIVEKYSELLPDDKIDLIADLVAEDSDPNEDVRIVIQSLPKEIQWKILCIIQQYFEFDEKTLRGETLDSLSILMKKHPEICGKKKKKRWVRPRIEEIEEEVVPHTEEDHETLDDNHFEDDFALPEFPPDSVFHIPKEQEPSPVPSPIMSPIQIEDDDEDDDDLEPSILAPRTMNTQIPVASAVYPSSIPISKWTIDPPKQQQLEMKKKEFWKSLNDQPTKKVEEIPRVVQELPKIEMEIKKSKILPSINQNEQRELMEELDSLLDF